MAEKQLHPQAAHAPRGGGRHALVTGGAGFIGSHLTDLLLARGDTVTVVDNLSTGRRGNLPEAHPRLRLLHADVSTVLPVLAGDVFHEVYHLAAAVGVKLVIADPIRSIETNIHESAAVLRFAARCGPGETPAPILIASSSEVYGKSSKNPFSEEDDVVYGPTTVARWSYAASKAVDEYLALAWHAQHRLPTVVARFFNTVGPRQVGEYGMVLPRFVQAALAGRDLEVYGDGEQSRCFCDVRDVARALPILLSTPACAGRVFNLGGDRPITMAQLADEVIRVLGSRSKVRKVPYTEAYGGGFEDLRQRRPDLSRIRGAIGFEAGIPLETTIRDVAAFLAASGAAGSTP